MIRAAILLRVVPAIALVVASACTSAFNVSTDQSRQRGVPFYVKKMIYRRHTTYEYAWLRLTLTEATVLTPASAGAAEQTGPRTTSVRDVRLTTANRERIRQLQQRVADFPDATSSDALAAIRTAFTDIEEVPPTHLSAPDRSLLRVTGNFVERVPVVDYGTTYYLNGKIPPFGTNNVSAELAADGTLSKSAAEGSGGVGDAIGAIASALTGTLPIKEYVTTKWVPTQKNMILKGGDRGLPSRVELTVEQQSVTFDFTKDSVSPPAATVGRVDSDFVNGTFTSRAGEKPAEKAPDGISFSGRVQLPEAKKP